MRARQSAPAVIVFDELDSFAAARGTYTGSGVEHSMVNQLLTEMDGFRKEELVFVVGTTNFVESLDPALLRPGRFEFALHIPYPNADDRRAILGVHDKRLGCEMTERGARLRGQAHRRARARPERRHALLRRPPPGAVPPARAHAAARGHDRRRPRPPTIDRAIEQYLDLPKLTTAEELVVATHEAGHAVCALRLHARAADRSDLDPRRHRRRARLRPARAIRAHRYVVTYAQLRDTICTLFGGREAEALLLDDVSIGAGSDLQQRDRRSRARSSSSYGEGGPSSASRGGRTTSDVADQSEHARSRLDHAIGKILETERARARADPRPRSARC